jgi:hypothetical protein
VPFSARLAAAPAASGLVRLSRNGALRARPLGRGSSQPISGEDECAEDHVGIVPDPESRRAGGRCLFLRFLIAPGHLCAGRVTSPVRPEAGELLLSRAGKLTVFTGVFVRREPEVTDGLFVSWAVCSRQARARARRV